MSIPALAEAKKTGFFYGWVVLGGALIICGISYSMRYSFSVFLSSLLWEFGWRRPEPRRHQWLLII
ncbi:MAG TPA: hypothetical protein VJZ49_14995 [Syntrophales bacterium]|nr:hypothetical protein [Syntrophales bacterium]